ncbi:hypothetical protein D3C80_1549980 [compost metagenome]
MAAGSRRLGDAGNDLRIWILWFRDWLAGWRAVVRHASWADYRKREALPHALCAGEYLPLDSFYYPAGVDDSIYPSHRGNIYWFAGGYRSADRRRRTIHRAYG